MPTNRFGVDEKDLVIRPHNITVNAERFINAMRDIQKKIAIEGKKGLTPSDFFTLQMAKIFKDWLGSGGTHTTLPDDIMEIYYPDWGKEKEF